MATREQKGIVIQAFLDAGNLTAAIETWRKETAEDFSSWKTLLALSQACASANQLQTAREVAEDGFRRTPTSSHLKAQIGAMTHAMGDPVEALVHFREALAIATAKQRSLPQGYLASLQLALDDLTRQVEALFARQDWAGVLDLAALAPEGYADVTIPPALSRLRKQALIMHDRGAQVDLAAMERNVSVAECSKCRAMDTAAMLDKIIEFLVSYARTAGETLSNTTLWKLPSPDGTRFAVAQPLASGFVVELRKAAEARGLSCTVRRRKIVPNLYEFDDVPYLSEKGYALELRWQPHCAAGTTYLQDRKITLELVETRKTDVLVPVAGLGPRLYSHEAIARLAVTEESQGIVVDWPFPIDLVYTWVDSSDPVWVQDYLAHVDEILAQAKLTAVASASRWRSRDELRYSLRSINMYAPFVRKIIIVTNGQKPRWLTDHPRIHVVSHAELYPDTSVLPTFNSNSIETVLHRIPGLAEHFLYLNDDFFFSRSCTPEDFFSIGGISKLFFSKRFLDAKPINPLGRATVACHKTTRDVLEARFGLDCSQKFQHAPHALRKSVWERIESEFPAELERTRQNRVRAFDDLALALIYGYYALFTGYAERGRIAYGYVEIGTDDIPTAFENIETRKIKVFCLNDCDAEDGVSMEDEILIRKTLQARYPVAAPWEADETTLAQSGADMVSISNPATLETEVRMLGLQKTEAAYLTILSGQISPAVAMKLFRLHLMQGRTDAALRLAVTAPWLEDQRVLAVATAELRREDGLAAILSRQPLLRSPSSGVILSLAEMLARSLRDHADLEAFDGWIAEIGSVYPLQEIDSQRLLALSALSVRQFDRVLRLLELPFQKIRQRGVVPRTVPQVPFKELPLATLEDFLNLAGPEREKIFLDGTTLRDHARLGRLSTIPGPIMLGTQSSDLFTRMCNVLKDDPAFLLWPDRAAAGQHTAILRTEHRTTRRIELRLIQPSDAGWVRPGEGFEWLLGAFDCVVAHLGDLPIAVPEPVDTYLEALFGQRWRSGSQALDPRIDGTGRTCTNLTEGRARLSFDALEQFLAGEPELAMRLLSAIDDLAV